MSILVPLSAKVRPCSNWLAVVDQVAKEVVVNEGEPMVFTQRTIAEEALHWCRSEWPSRQFGLQIVMPWLYPPHVQPAE